MSLQLKKIGYNFSVGFFGISLKIKEFFMAGRGRPSGDSGVNKSDAIRKYYDSNPDAKTKDVVKALGEQGIDVSPALVAGVRARHQGVPGNKRRRKAKGEVTLAEVKILKEFISKSGVEEEMATTILGSFADLVEEIGDVDRFREVLAEFGSFSEAEASEEDSAEEDEVDDEGDDEDDEDEDYEEDEDDE